jgi:hypothetical protein
MGHRRLSERQHIRRAREISVLDDGGEDPELAERDAAFEVGFD